MIFPVITFFLAVVALVGLVRSESFAAQAIFAFWAVLLTILTAQASTDEAIEERRKSRETA